MNIGGHDQENEWIGQILRFHNTDGEEENMVMKLRSLYCAQKSLIKGLYFTGKNHHPKTRYLRMEQSLQTT